MPALLKLLVTCLFRPLSRASVLTDADLERDGGTIAFQMSNIEAQLYPDAEEEFIVSEFDS